MNTSKWAKFKGLTPAQRLSERENYYTEYDALPLMIKSGDFEGIQWMYEKGFPINFKVIDNDGKCYLATELAEHHGQAKIANFFKDQTKKGPPRQKLRVTFGNKELEFIMANSKEDWHMFKDEVCRAFGIQKCYLCTKGDPENKPLKWTALREGRRYVAFEKK
eukprot:TRINITY_DN8923_c0_g1_i1.p1 TRINITY_DN8923_c0_g1~~TRINITY_DN8923_c0_g1_i1.p1  ORF type:complete len:176 (+),score=37.14 TRINITY_DN8923_c0_g1_i1:42-530(+)